MERSCWEEMIVQEMKTNDEDWRNIKSIEIERADGESVEVALNRQFDRSYGLTEGRRFCIWTTHFVYFPICYDGSEWVGSVSRNPNGRPIGHQGG